MLRPVDVKDLEIGQVLPNPVRSISAELFRSGYTTVEGYDAPRTCLLNSALDSNLICDPFCSDEVTTYESDAVLEGEIVDFLTVDDRDDDLVVANDALPSSRPKRQTVRAWTIDRLVVH